MKRFFEGFLMAVLSRFGKALIERAAEARRAREQVKAGASRARGKTRAHPVKPAASQLAAAPRRRRAHSKAS